jgi:hypothetical protein
VPGYCARNVEDIMRSIFHYYYFDGFKVDVYGYNHDTEQFDYSVETEYNCKCRKAKKRYKSPDKRNPWCSPYGTYIYIINPKGKKVRLFLNT